jgi:AraC-like DNA-binding protein
MSSLAHRERLRIARTYIDCNYSAPLTVDGVSQEAGFSTFHFIRLFRATYRQTPHQYLIQRRVDRAKALLATSNLSIRDICFEVGFVSLGSFSTLFRRATGLSPAAYRRSLSPIVRQPATPPHIPLCHRVMLGLQDPRDV